MAAHRWNKFSLGESNKQARLRRQVIDLLLQYSTNLLLPRLPRSRCRGLPLPRARGGTLRDQKTQVFNKTGGGESIEWYPEGGEESVPAGGRGARRGRQRRGLQRQRHRRVLCPSPASSEQGCHRQCRGRRGFPSLSVRAFGEWGMGRGRVFPRFWSFSLHFLVMGRSPGGSASFCTWDVISICCWALIPSEKELS